MLFASRLVSELLDRNPSLKILGLCFLFLVGILLIADAFGQHIPRAYVYFALGFSSFVEIINMRQRVKSKPS
jgi:predicted tellurium resistance membrane protein TerC